MSVTTWTDATSFLAFVRQYNYDQLFDTDDDGSGDSSAVTTAIEQGAIKLNHYGSNFNSDTKEQINNLFALEYGFMASRQVGPIHAAIKAQLDFWTNQLEAYSNVNFQPILPYNPEEGVEQDYIDDLRADPV